MGNSLEQVEGIKFAGFDTSQEWKCYLSDCSPLAGRIDKRNSYAEWLGAPEAQRKGLYIWLYALNGGGYRFVHVGLAKRGASTLASRLRAHCRNAFTVDPTYRLSEGNGAFGCLVPLEKPRIDEVAAKQFLDQMRILLMIPEKDEGAIARMEGLIAHAAAKVLGGEPQITNTLTKVQVPPEGTNYTSIVQPLNAAVRMLPDVNQDQCTPSS